MRSLSVSSGEERRLTKERAAMQWTPGNLLLVDSKIIEAGYEIKEGQYLMTVHWGADTLSSGSVCCRYDLSQDRI